MVSPVHGNLSRIQAEIPLILTVQFSRATSVLDTIFFTTINQEAAAREIAGGLLLFQSSWPPGTRPIAVI
jgi:hypothetical protein